MTDPRVTVKAYLADLRASMRLRGLSSSDVTDEVYDHFCEVADAATRHGDDPLDACTAAMARLGPPATLAARFAAAKENPMDKFILPIAIICGLAIRWVDSSPGWDDTGVTAFALLATAGILALLAPRRVWLLALGVGVWIPLHAITTGGDWRMLFVLLFPLAGAYGGLAVRKLAASTAKPN